MNKYTEEEKVFIRNNTEGKTSQQLADMFNGTFNKNATAKQMYEYKKSHRLKSGVKTHFIKGKRPHNYKPIGSEFIDKNGYTFIKTEDPNTWIHKQQYIYEQQYGKIPKNHSVIFADGNKNNFDLDNFLLVENKNKLMMKNKHLIFNDKDLTKTGLLIAQLINKSAERRKDVRGDKS
jgi:hypothetical protein